VNNQPNRLHRGCCERSNARLIVWGTCHDVHFITYIDFCKYSLVYRMMEHRYDSLRAPKIYQCVCMRSPSLAGHLKRTAPVPRSVRVRNLLCLGHWFCCIVRLQRFSTMLTPSTKKCSLNHAKHKLGGRSRGKTLSRLLIKAFTIRRRKRLLVLSPVASHHRKCLKVGCFFE
jgi:hypothetical protein